MNTTDVDTAADLGATPESEKAEVGKGLDTIEAQVSRLARTSDPKLMLTVVEAIRISTIRLPATFTLAMADRATALCETLTRHQADLEVDTTTGPLMEFANRCEV
jgi:hypothetical protein